MKHKKPDVLVVLAAIFGLGVLASTISYGGAEQEARFGDVAKQAGVIVPASPK